MPASRRDRSGRPYRRARADLRDALGRLAEQNIAAARELNDAVQRAAARLGRNPSLGARRPGLTAGHYLWPLRRWGYLLVYTDRTDPPRILRVVHMARNVPRLLSDLPH